MTDTHTIVREIITSLMPDKPAHLVQVGSGQRLDDLGFDSLDRHEIALKIEERFNIDIEDGVPEAWITVQDVIDSALNELGECHVPKQGDFVNVTIHSNGKVDVKPGTPPAINRIERADVEEFNEWIDENNSRHVNNLDHYQSIATKSAIYPGKGTPFGLMYAALGLAEAGEVQNKVKKAFRDDHIMPLLEESGGFGHATAKYEIRKLTDERRAQIIKELGGAMWYIAAVCDEIGATMSEVALQNLDELCGRGERDTLRGDGDNR